MGHIYKRPLPIKLPVKTPEPTVRPTVNLVVATWSGRRRLAATRMQEYYDDCSLFLKKQIKCLSTVKHNLDQITFVAPHNPEECREFKEYIETLPDKINDTKIVLLRRENIGMSYGSFSYAFEQFKEVFQYYIFLEDDYVFVENDFDKTLVKFFNQSPGCGYLCSTVYRGKHWPDHPANFNGITTSKILSHLWRIYGRLPYPNCKSYKGAQDDGQVAYGVKLMRLGYKLHDLTKYYSMPFMEGNGAITYYGKGPKKIIVPLQTSSF